MKPTNLVIILGSAILGGLYLTNKKAKDKAKADADALMLASALATAQPPATNVLINTAPVLPAEPVEDLTGRYSTAEATKKALTVVTKWISLLDAIPKEFLTQENKNIINQRIWAEKEKQAKIDYDKALAEAKLKNLSKFTFQGTTFWTANEEDTRNGSFIGSIWKLNNPYGNYFSNSFKYRESVGEAILMNANLIKIASMNNPNDPATLGDYVKLVKTQKFSEIYDRLKVVFTELPKSDVNRLVEILPKYLMAVSDNFAYFQTEYEKNPFTIEEQLYLKDINLEQLLSPPRISEINWTTLMQNQPYRGDGLLMTSNAVPTPIIRAIR